MINESQCSRPGLMRASLIEDISFFSFVWQVPHTTIVKHTQATDASSTRKPVGSNNETAAGTAAPPEAPAPPAPAAPAEAAEAAEAAVARRRGYVNALISDNNKLAAPTATTT